MPPYLPRLPGEREPPAVDRFFLPPRERAGSKLNTVATVLIIADEILDEEFIGADYLFNRDNFNSCCHTSREFNTGRYLIDLDAHRDALGKP